MKLFWILLCCGGLFAQIFMLTLQYMQYEISTSVTFTFEDIINLPAITICGNILELGNWDDERLRKHCGNLTGSSTCMNETAEQITSYVVFKVPLTRRLPLSFKFMDYFTISEIMQLTHNMDKLIMGHMRYNSETGGTDKRMGVDDTFDVTHFLTGIYKCMTLTWKKQYETASYLKLKRQFTSSGMLVTFVRSDFLIDKVSMLTFSYTGNRKNNTISDSDVLVISARRAISSSSYDLYKSKFLEAPFATNCVNYRSVYGVASRSHCYESCFIEACVRNLKRKPIGVWMDEEDGSMMAMSETFVEEHYEEISRLSKDCDSRCFRQDCIQIVHSARMKSSARDDNGTISGYVSYVPNSPVVVTECMQKVTFAEFVTDVGSTFGFWLGLSVLTAFTWLQKLTLKILRKRSCKRTRAKKERKHRNNLPVPRHHRAESTSVYGIDLSHVRSFN